MMTTLLELLSTLGQATWQPVWMPILAWTLLVLPFWGLLERTNRLHPHAEYRLYQVLLAALPVGMLATALLDGPWASTAGVSNTGLSVVVMPPAEPTVQSSADAPSLTWLHGVGLATVAALGTGVVGLGRLALDGIALARVRRSIGHGSPSADPQTIADRMARRLGVRRPVRVHTALDAAVPITLGGLSPTVLLPPTLLNRPDALRMTLAHELVHVRRYDDISHLIERAIRALFSPHPLVGRLASQIADARERACDAAVVADADTSPSAYARLLATFADERTPQIGTLTLSESPSSLTTRLRAMQSSISDWLASPLSLTAGLLAVGLAVTFGVVACSDSVGSSATSQSESPTPSAKGKTSDEVFVEVEQRPDCGGVQALSEEVQYPDLARQAGIGGRVFVQFIVNENGDVIEPQVTRGVHESLDQAALDAVKSLDCKPGRQRRTPVKVRMALPVTFRLPDSSETAPSSTSSSTGSFNVPADGTIDVDEAPVAAEQSNAPPHRPPALRMKGGLDALYEKLEYPDLVRKAGIEGRVVVKFTVDENGLVQNPTVLQSPHEALTSAALDALKQVTFDPARSGSKATSSKMTLPITFRLDNESDESRSDAGTPKTDSESFTDTQVVRVLMNENGHLLIGSDPVDHSNLTDAVRQRITTENAQATLLYADGAPSDRVAAAEASLRDLDLRTVRVERVK